jgi:hypothetical protein
MNHHHSHHQELKKLHLMFPSRFFDTAQCFSSEAHLTNQYQVCDNIDLGTIVQDFETYYCLRFQKYPKICKKIPVEENRKTIPKKAPHPDSGFHDNTKPHATNLQNEMQKENKLHVRNTSGKASSICVPVQKSLKNNNSLSDFNLTVLPLTHEGFTNMHINSTQTDVQDNPSENFLKPLSGCSAYNTEWKEFAEVISKVNIGQLIHLMVCSDSTVPISVLRRILFLYKITPRPTLELFQSAVNWRPCILVQCISCKIRFLAIIFKEVTGNISLTPVDTHTPLFTAYQSSAGETWKDCVLNAIFRLSSGLLITYCTSKNFMSSHLANEEAIIPYLLLSQKPSVNNAYNCLQCELLHCFTKMHILL